MENSRNTMYSALSLVLGIYVFRKNVKLCRHSVLIRTLYVIFGLNRLSDSWTIRFLAISVNKKLILSN